VPSFVLKSGQKVGKNPEKVGKNPFFTLELLSTYLLNFTKKWAEPSFRPQKWAEKRIAEVFLAILLNNKSTVK
jgi:hypothetical protein